MQYAHDLLQKMATQSNQVQQPSTASKYSKQASSLVKMWVQLCLLLGLLKGADSTALFSDLVRLILNRTCRAHTTNPAGQSDLTPRRSRRGSGTGARFSPHTDAGASRQGLGGVEGVGEVPVINLTGSQVANRCQKIEGLVKKSGTKHSKEATDEGKDQRDVQTAKGSSKLRITLFNGSSMGTVQRVLEQDIGMQDVFVGVERRLRGGELREFK